MGEKFFFRFLKFSFLINKYIKGELRGGAYSHGVRLPGGAYPQRVAFFLNKLEGNFLKYFR